MIILLILLEEINLLSNLFMDGSPKMEEDGLERERVDTDPFC